MTLESDDEGIVEFELRQPGLSPGDRVIVNVESVAAVDPAELARFHDNLADPTGELEVPVVSQRYAWTRWSFPDSKVRLETCFRSACD